MILTSPQFENEGWMPDSTSGYGEDRSPELHVAEIPEGTVSMAITMDDLDHPIQPGFNHWVAWNLPAEGIIPGNLPKGEAIDKPIHIEQGLGYGKHCYRGPKPPFNWKHRYRFTVYAVDIKIHIGPNSKKEDLLKALENHVLASAELVGIYQRKHS